MTPAEISLVRDSWRRLGPLETALAGFFYETLFLHKPGLRELFTQDLTEQKHKMIKKIGAFTSGLDQPEESAKAMYRLGAQHAEFGIQPDQYQMMFEVFYQAMSVTLGERWSKADNAAWRKAIETYREDILAGDAAVRRSKKGFMWRLFGTNKPLFGFDVSSKDYA